MNARRLVAPLFLVALQAASAWAQSATDLADISLDDLMKIEVTSVSKKEQELFGTPSAIFVLTSDDIRRAGATTVAEALRLVPGIHVARLAGNRWEVAARGFNWLYNDKLVVLVDGLNVYDPTFGGVNWQLLDVSVDDLDRIEVIRGPAATVLGANAINGVVNIFTKHARLTQGGLVTLGSGTVDRADAGFRYGGRVGAEGYYRATLNGTLDGAMPGAGSVRGADPQRQLVSADVRVDLRPSTADTLHVQSGVTAGALRDRGEAFIATPPFGVEFDTLEPAHDLNLMTRWTRRASPRSESSLLASVRRSSYVAAQVPVTSGVVALNFQNRVTASRHDVVWDVDYRMPFDRVQPTASIVLDPERSVGRNLSVAIQDEIALDPRTLHVTVGARLQSMARAELDVEPSVRIAWVPRAAHSFWAAVSEAEHDVSRSSRDVNALVDARFDAGTAVLLVKHLPNPVLGPEELWAYEAGYRTRWQDRITVDSSAFYNHYSWLVGTAPVGMFFEGPQPLLGVQSVNGTRATTAGLETTMRARLRGRWTVDGSYALLRSRFRTPGEVVPPRIGSPVHQWNAGSQVFLPAGWRADGRVYVVGRVEGATPGASIDPYARVDVRMSRSLMRGLTVSLIGQNLADASHREAADFTTARGTAIPRSASVKLTWQF